LGDIILLGIDRNNTSLIVIGAVPAALLAILFDLLLRWFEQLSFKKSVASVGLITAIAIMILAAPLLAGGKKDEIVIAGKLGSEPEILINMYKQLIEKKTDLQVELKPGLGKTTFLFNALRNESIDIYPEFTGTAISEFLKETAASTDRKEVYEQARKGLYEEYGLVMLKPMAYNNTYALAVPKHFADQYQLARISDLEAVTNKVKAGFTLEFSDREDVYKGIQRLYGFTFPNMATMEPKLRYNAVKTGNINLIDAYSTDSEIEQHQLVVLEDDKHLFPPYQGAPLMRKETAEKYPEIAAALNGLAGKITDDEMRKMNYEVNVEGKSPGTVAREYLEREGLLGKD
jgi:osmoprotectant transport system permease protein